MNGGTNLPTAKMCSTCGLLCIVVIPASNLCVCAAIRGVSYTDLMIRGLSNTND